MDNKEVSHVNNKEVTVNVGKEKSNLAVQIIGMSVYLVIAVVISLVFGMKQMESAKVGEDNSSVKEDVTNTPVINEPVKLAIDANKGLEFSTNLGNILQNVFVDVNHLVSDSNRNSTNLLVDEVLNFKLVYYIAEKYVDIEHKTYNINSNGVEELGAYAINYEYFKTYYKELVGVDFNEEVLTKVGDSFIHRGDNLFGKVLLDVKTNYNLTAESFIQEKNNYYFTVLVNEVDVNNQVALNYKIRLGLSKINDKYILNEIVVA
jgi:hypothetical protein